MAIQRAAHVVGGEDALSFLSAKTIGQTCSADDQVCEPISDNPLAAYPYLAIALDRDSLQMLQDAAYRREHLRSGIPYDGPQGLRFAQGYLNDFLAPGTEYVSREELLSALLPGLLDAARNHADAEPFVAEIARNEAARQILEPIGNPLVNVELPDPDGLEAIPTYVTFSADFKQLQDDHGALALASLDPLSKRSAYLWTLIALGDAHQLAEIAVLNAKTEWLLEKYGDRLKDMIADPADYTQDEVYALAHDVMPDLVKQANVLSSVLMPGNRDQADLIAKIITSVQTLSARADKAWDEMNKFREDEDHIPPERTEGELWEDNADAIREHASKDWDEGGWSYLGWFGNKLGLGANKLIHGSANIFSGGYMDIHAARVHNYRLGHISYNDYIGFHPSDYVKGAIGDLAVAMPFFGKIGAGASVLLGLEEGTVAAGYVEGSAAGFSGGLFGAAATDATSFLASHLSMSESERRFQAAQIGGPLSWIESGAWGGVVGGPAGALSKLMPKPASAPQRAAVEGEPATSGEAQADESAMVSTAEEPSSSLTSNESVAGDTAMSKPASGIIGYLQRSLLNKLFSSALEGAEPLYSMPQTSGPIGDQLISVSENRGPLVSISPGDLLTGPIDFANAPDLPASSAAPVEAPAVLDVSPPAVDVAGPGVVTVPAAPTAARSASGHFGSLGAMARLSPEVQAADRVLRDEIATLTTRTEAATRAFGRFTSGPRRDLLMARAAALIERLRSYEQRLTVGLPGYRMGRTEPALNEQAREAVEWLRQRMYAATIHVQNLERLTTPVPLPNDADQALIDEYVCGLGTLREQQERLAAGDATAQAARNATRDRLIEIEQQGARRDTATPFLLEHVEGLAQDRRRLVGPQGLIATQTGSQPAVDSATVVPNGLAGRNFEQISQALAPYGPPTIVLPEGSTTPGRLREPVKGAVSLTWILPDRSSIRLDVPGPGTRPFFIGSQPHLTRVGPPVSGSRQQQHYADNGVAVPTNSTPAHIPVTVAGPSDPLFQAIQTAREQAVREAGAPAGKQ